MFVEPLWRNLNEYLLIFFEVVLLLLAEDGNLDWGALAVGEERRCISSQRLEEPMGTKKFLG